MMLMKLATMMISVDCSEPDKLGWGEEKYGVFTVKQAYDSLREHPTQQQSQGVEFDLET